MLARKLIKFTPDKMGYKDRGKMKWQGLILSDHTEAVQSMFKSDSVHPEAKNVMSEVDISEVLLQAYIMKVPVNIQSNIFGKRHDSVLRDLDNLKENFEGSPQNWGDLFHETTYTHTQNNQQYREYYMTKDGFTLLAMGFTGKKALDHFWSSA